MEPIHSDWQRREELVDQLLDMNADERAAFIDAVAAESPRDADALRKWLRGIEQPLDYLDANSPALVIARGDQVGSWRVLSPIGRGGMGEVWLGERADGLFEKKVAIKFIRGDRAGLSSSIESERRLLAGLQHPGIVRLLDAGVNADGHAFLVTDFIEGTTLDVWLEQRKPPLSQRLDLLRQVAEAIAYAHEKLVIHRDIKPRNILVDRAGRAYLLDFGIARALADAGDTPQTTNLVLTPEFAAPELIVENVASVRSDIYALGGLLYFLLCAKPPLSVRGLPLLSAIKIIRDASPPHTGDVAHSLFPAEPRRLLADLDAIALKALAKSPRDRYGTVEAFLADIDAARGSRPIQARPPNAWDLAQRYLRRHKIAIAVGTIVVVSLLAGMAGTLWQAHQARLQSARAEEEAARATAAAKNANAVRDFLLNVFDSANPDKSPGKVPTASELLDSGVRRIDTELGNQPELQAQLLDTMGMAYSFLVQIDKATDILRRARTIAAASSGEDSALTTKITLDFVTAVVNRTSDHRIYEELTPWLERIVKRDSRSGEPIQRVDALRNYGAMLRNLGDLKQSEAYLRQAITLGRAIGPAGEEALANAGDELGLTLMRDGRVLETIDQRREVLAIRSRLLPMVSLGVAQTQRDLAMALSNAGKMDEAAELMTKALDSDRVLLGETNPLYAIVLGQLASIRDRQGRLDEAETSLLQALAILKKSGVENEVMAMNVYTWLGIVKAHQKDLEQAIPYMRKALAISTKAYGETASDVLVKRINLAAVEALNGSYAEAERELREVLVLSKQVGSNNIVPPLQYLGFARRLRGDPAEARALHADAIVRAKKMQGETSDLVFRLYVMLALDERDLGQLDQARSDAETARDGFVKLQNGADTPDVQEARYSLAGINVLRKQCADGVDDLESTWKRRKGMKDSPVNRWQAAEAGMFLAVCRKQTGHPDDAQSRELLDTSIRTLRTSPLADPFIKRFAASMK